MIKREHVFNKAEMKKVRQACVWENRNSFEDDRVVSFVGCNQISEFGVDESDKHGVWE